MSPLDSERKAHLHDHADLVPHANFSHGSTVLGHSLSLSAPQFRYAASGELETDTSGPDCEECVLPIIIYAAWSMNLAEFFKGVPTALNRLQSAGALDSSASLVQFVPEKLPMEGFNRWILQAFSQHAPASLAEFSRLREDHTGDCYQDVVLLKVAGGAFPAIPAAARAILDYYTPQLPPSPWSSLGRAGVTRVLFETRPNRAMRQLGGMEDILGECAKRADLECRTHTFGNHTADMALMQGCDVLVSYHGAGQTNAQFMKKGSAMLEVHARDFGTKFLWWSAFWQPMIVMQTNFELFFWGLNVEDESLNTNSALEAEGLEKDATLNARDRYVTLQWQFVEPMLAKIQAVGRNATTYAELTAGHMAHVLYSWKDGALSLDPPIFCSGECGKELTVDCRPC